MNLSEQLRILSIFHYVVGGLHALIGSFGLIHFSLGLMFMMDPKFLPSSSGGPPFWIGLLFAAVGGSFVLFGWVLGFLTILSGRYIAARKKRAFSIVMGAINCAMVPVGTVLGVFDIILLSKEETKRLYGEGGPEGGFSTPLS